MTLRPGRLGDRWAATALAALDGDAALQAQMRAVVLESNMAGLDEFGPRWFQCVEANTHGRGLFQSFACPGHAGSPLRRSPRPAAPGLFCTNCS